MPQGSSAMLDESARVRTRLPLMWARKVRLILRVAGEVKVTDVELVIASPGCWRKITSLDGRPWTRMHFGPFCVGVRAS